MQNLLDFFDNLFGKIPFSPDYEHLIVTA